METTRTRPSDQTTQPAARLASGPLGDLRRLQEGGKATAAELKEFLGRMRGRSPQEVLGELANSSLVRCTLAAAGITALLMVVLTLVPWYFGTDEPKTAKTGQPAPAAPAETEPASAPAAATAATEPEKSNIEKAAEKMDLIETKPADPGQNPLDKDLDKLLDIKD